MEASNAPQQRPQAAPSRDRILAAGTMWHKVLDVAISASAEDVKRAYRSLALLHHPDKADGDADTFKRVKEAYEVGVKKALRRLALATKSETKSKEKTNSNAKVKVDARVKAKAKSKVQTKVQTKAKEEAKPYEPSEPKQTQSANARASFSKACEKEEAKAARAKALKPQAWKLAEDASKRDIRKAVASWQRSERWQDKVKPEDVQTILPDDLAAHLQANSCIPVDVLDNAALALEMRGVAQVSFAVIMSTPEEAAPEIARLRASGKLVILISDKGEAMSTCGLVGAILLDVFGLDRGKVRRLQGGHAAWRQWSVSHQNIAKTLAPEQLERSSTSTASPSVGKSDGASRKRARPKLWEMPASASASKVHKAIELWESSDRWDEKTLPTQVSEISSRQLAEWIRASACVTLDARKASDVALEGSHLGVSEAVPISFSQMVLNSAEVLQQVATLKKEGKRVVLFSEVGGRVDACGLLGALLIDVLGFDQQLICRLEGGCAAWGQWLEENRDEARTLESLSVRLERSKRRRIARACAPAPAAPVTSSLGAWAAACNMAPEGGDTEVATPETSVKAVLETDSASIHEQCIHEHGLSFGTSHEVNAKGSVDHLGEHTTADDHVGEQIEDDGLAPEQEATSGEAEEDADVSRQCSASSCSSQLEEEGAEDEEGENEAAEEKEEEEEQEKDVVMEVPQQEEAKDEIEAPSCPKVRRNMDVDCSMWTAASPCRVAGSRWVSMSPSASV